MKLVLMGRDRRLGAVVGDRVIDLRAAEARARSDAFVPMFTLSLDTLIAAGEEGLDMVEALIEEVAGSDQPQLSVPLASARLQAPFPGKRLAFAGRNNAAHVANGLINRGVATSVDEVRTRTRAGRAGGFFVVTPPAGPGQDVETPRCANGLFDYEGELGIILAQGGKRVSAEDWSDRVWGTVLVNDWSVRGETEALSALPFYGHKNFDGSTSLGPWIVVREAVEPAEWEVVTCVNGQERQRFNTRDMIHSYWELLEQLSQDITLLPGDILSGGTGPGTAVDSTVVPGGAPTPQDLFLHPGDVVEVSSPCHGVLRTTIVAPS